MKEGYKETPIGMIPKEWDVVKIKDIAEVKGGKRLPKGESLIESKTPYPYIRVSDMFMGGIKTEKILYVPVNIQPAIKRYTISKDDLFISVAGTLGLVGKIPMDLDGANLTENADKLTNIKCNKDFLFQILMSDIIQNTIINECTWNAQPKLALTRIQQFEVPLPTDPEQSKIASILSTVDNKIDSINKRIEETQKLKQGLIQQLLTRGIGHTRFKDSPLGEIPESWEVVPLGNLRNKSDRYSFTGGPFGSNLKAEHYTNEGVRIIQLQNIGEGSFLDESKVFTSKGKADELSSCNIFPDEIILAKMAPVARSCKIPNFHERYVMCSDGIRLSVDKNKFDNDFVFQALNSEYFLQSAESKSTGTTRARIGLNDLRKLPIAVPKNKQEQSKIASILSIVDDNVGSSLEKKTEYEKLKKGLMQQLLAGKIRVKTI